MGNRLCKNKGDAVDNANCVAGTTTGGTATRGKSPSRFDRIITRLHLKPTTWKSESYLNKESNRSKSEERKNGDSIFYTTKPMSKSSDWTEVDLEVPTNEDEHIHLRNPTLNLIFDNDKGTPTPPPRKQPKTSNLREKIGRIANRSLQAFQSDKTKNAATNQAPVDEPLIVKKQINYDCPVCDGDEKSHNRDHHHHHHNQARSEKDPETPSSPTKKTRKRHKNLSVVSLPNYTDLKLSVAHPDGTDRSKPELTSSRLSLQHPEPKRITSSQSTSKLDSYITRCRSFGSQQLKKLKLQKTKPEDITSDDSFGPLEDWDVGLIEHYDPKDASLPRPRKKSDGEVLAGIEGLIVTDEEIEKQKPQRPVRRSESLVKKTDGKEVSATVAGAAAATAATKPVPEEICLTPPPSPVHENVEQSNTDALLVVGKGKKVAALSKHFENGSVPKRNKIDGAAPSPQSEVKRVESVCEHSGLMRILQEFSMKDKQQEKTENVGGNEADLPSLTPSLVEFEKTLSGNSATEDFLNAEKNFSKAVNS